MMFITEDAAILVSTWKAHTDVNVKRDSIYSQMDVFAQVTRIFNKIL